MTKRACSSPDCKNEGSTIALVIRPNADPAELAFCKNHVDELGMEFLLPDLEKLDPAAPCDSLQACRLHSVLFMNDPVQYVLVMRNTETRAVFVLQTGYIEAVTIYNLAKERNRQHPATHDLIKYIVEALGQSILDAVVSRYDNQTRTYTSELVLGTEQHRARLNCRVSDLIALSLVVGVPVRINSALLGKDEKSA